MGVSRIGNAEQASAQGRGLGCQLARPVKGKSRSSPQRGREVCIRVNAKWANTRSHGKRKVPTPTPDPKPQQNYVDWEKFELPELPDLEDVRADRVIRGSLIGTFVGTVLSVVVSPVQYVLAASAVASGVSLVPYFDAKDLKSAADQKGAELPGQAAATGVAQGQDVAEGAKAEGSAATVAASALVAGSTVSLFAAKSLPLVFGASAIYVAAQADNDLNLAASTLRGRDFLRSRKEAGVGIVFSLIAVQARRAVDAVTAWNQGQATLRPAIATQPAFADGPISGTLAQASRSPSPRGKVTSIKADPASSDGAATPLQNIKGGGTEKAPEPFEPSLSDSILGGNTSGSKKGFEPSLQDSILQSGSASATADKPGTTPLEKVKGGNKDVGSGDLATGPVKTKESKPLLQPDSPATKTPGSGTPLEKAKGGNSDVSSGDLATGKPGFVEKDSVLQKGSSATKTPGLGTPLEQVKGGNEKAGADSLPTAKTDFSQNKEGVLTGSSPATRTPGSGTPLENVKGGNQKVDAGDLTTGKTDFAQNKEGVLSKDSPATKTPGSESPLENVKGGNKNVSAGDLTTGKTGFAQNKDGLLSGDSGATKPPSSSSTPLQNVKGSNRDMGVGDLATGPANFKAAAQEPVLQGTSPTPAGASPLESLKGSPSSQGPVNYEEFGSSFPRADFGLPDSNSLLLQSSKGLGKALLLQSFRADPATAASLVQGGESGKEALLDKLAQKEDAKRSSQTPTRGSSSSVKSILSKPFEAGKSALEQTLPPTKSSTPPKRSAAGPSEISKLATKAAAPRALVRPVTEPGAIEGLQKPEAVGSAAVPTLAPRANIAVRPPAQTPQKQTLVDKLLVLAGTGVLGSLLGVVYYLVNGQTIAHVFPRNLLTVAFCCIAAIVLLVSLGKRNPKEPAIVTNAA